jgi:beta-D-xylosidase 4
LLQLPDCTKPPLKHNLVCNTSAPWLERAKAVVDLFTMDEIVDNLGNGALGAPRIGMPPYQWWGEALVSGASAREIVGYLCGER